MATQILTQDYLRSLFHYDPETGVLTWKWRPREHFNSDRSWKGTNTRCSGKLAGVCTNSEGYPQVGIDGRIVKTHRIIWLLVYGIDPIEVDHLNGVRNDNRLSNLCATDRGGNMKNKATRKDSRSGVAGVGWHSKDRRWIAYIRVSGKQKRLGAFTEFSEACEARAEAEKQYGYHENHGRPAS